MTEKEYKCLIDEETYKKTEDAYKWDSVKNQTNNYYAAETDILAKNRITVRIREKDGVYKIQVKRHKNEESALHISEELEFDSDGAPDIIDAQKAREITGVETGALKKIGALTTLRHSFMWDKYTEICLDKSIYLDRSDYELEVEYQKEMPKKLFEELEKLGADFSKPVTGKYSRFVKRLKEIMSNK